MIVTIDGPAGAGKSSVARQLAQRLGFAFLDTGAMYRAVAWKARERNVDWQQPGEVETVAREMVLSLDGDAVVVDGQDVREEIRTPAVTECIRYAAENLGVREVLTDLQRQFAAQVPNLVTEGRDQGTTVFPRAECKIFLTATPEERAKRRYHELLARGEQITFPEVLASQNERDAGDTRRAVGALAKADDAVEVYTDGMSPEQVVSHLEWIVRSSGTRDEPSSA